MLKITNISIKNFLSIGNVTQAVRLNENGLTLVLGENTDSNGGITRNGAGKSTILQAVSYAIFGKPLTKIKLPNLVNNINGKQMLVAIEFQEGGRSYRIERGKKPDVMKFYVDAEEQKLDGDETKGENRETQKEIERIFGMSHTMFKHIVALNTFTDPFLKMSVGDQRTVIEELLGIMQISQRAEVLKKLIGQTKENIRDCDAGIKAMMEANDRIDRAIKSAEFKVQSWDTAHEARLAQLAEELATLEVTDFEAEIATFDRIDAYDQASRDIEAERSGIERESKILATEHQSLTRDINRLEGEVETGSQAQITRMEGEISRRINDAERATLQRNRLNDDLTGVDRDLNNPDQTTCSCCGQSINGTDHLATIMATLTQRRDDLIISMGELKDREDEATRDAQAVRDEIAAIRSNDIERSAQLCAKIAQLVKTRDDIGAELFLNEDKSTQIGDKLAELGPRPKAQFRSRDEVYRARRDRDNIERTLEHEIGQTNPNLSQIDDLTAALQTVDFGPLNEQSDLLSHQEYLLKLLTSKDSFIRKKIIDQNLAYLNGRLNHYLDKLGLPHEVIFQSDLSVDITKLGRDMDFEQLSRGEMNRVIMATSWSFRDVWESQNQSINLMWLDEVLDSGTDTPGVEAALSILKSMARDRSKNIFLISHREELQARIDKTLLVTKENGFTAITTE